MVEDQKHLIKEKARQMYDRICSQNAKFLGCPVLYCNKVGKWKQPSPTKFIPMTFDTEFPGSCAICDATGTLVGERLGTYTPGILSGDVVLASKEKREQMTIPRYWGGFSDGFPGLKVWLIYEWLGARSYNRDELRKQPAKEALSN